MEGKAHRPAWKTLLAFAIIYFVWGSTFLGIRVGVREVPPLLFAAMRFFTAGGALFCLVVGGGGGGARRGGWGGFFLPRGLDFLGCFGDFFFVGGSGAPRVSAAGGGA